MNSSQFSDFEKYILVSDKTKLLHGTYPAFLRLKELLSSLSQMVKKNSNTYTEIIYSHLAHKFSKTNHHI